MSTQTSSKRKVRAISAIISRNVFLLIHAIIFAVVVLLTVFGDTREGIFLGLITVINICIGCFQEINAWLTLERLQLLASPRVIRVDPNGAETEILAEDVKAGDDIKLKTGDQIPCDGSLTSSHGFEVNEGLITGESKLFLKKPGDMIYAGSIITSGSGTFKVEKIFAESRIALMTKSIKRYSLIESPIQHSISLIIRYTGYVLMAVILFVVLRGVLLNESTISIVQSIGALTSVLVPQGMVVIVTLLFSYGAIHLYKKHVLLQEINATEKIGRIKNLCMDKTGTLTDNEITIEHVHVAPGQSEQSANESVSAYIKSTGDTSQTIKVVKKMFPGEYSGDILGDLTFSSTRKFGAVHMRDAFGERVVFGGAPDIFLPYLSSAEDKKWLEGYIDTEGKKGKRLLCFVGSDLKLIPESLSGTKLKVVSLFILNNNLRHGVQEAVRFFQERGVKIRIISGDNAETVAAVATAAGIVGTESIITGAELEAWTDPDYLEKAKTYTLFARIKPEQKERIIEALKRDGFTAMVGDGANDALAIKKADLGIAMFAGAQATRQIAAVVLVENSFVDLPEGVRLADSIIQNIEICASTFFNQSFLGLFFFLVLAFLGYAFPFTPLNITFINYFTVGLPGFLIFYWIIRPVHTYVVRHNQSFLKQVLPFAFVSAIPQTLVAVFAFYYDLDGVKESGPASLVVVMFIALGVIFFMFAPRVYSGPTTWDQKREFVALVIFEAIAIIALIKIPFVTSFYNLTTPSISSIVMLLPLVLVYALVQYAIVKWIFGKHAPVQTV